MTADWTSHPPPLAAWLQDHARPILRRYFSPDSCIESTAAAVDFLRANNVAARPLPVQTMIFNQAGWRLFNQGCYINASPTDRATWAMLGAWSIGIGFIDTPIPRPGRYGGHLVALVEERWLLDLAIDQASRPGRGLTFPDPILAPVADLDDLDAGLSYERPDGVTLVYRLSREIWADAYRATPGWLRRAQRRMIADQLYMAHRLGKEVPDGAAGGDDRAVGRVPGVDGQDGAEVADRPRRVAAAGLPDPRGGGDPGAGLGVDDQGGQR